MFDVLIKNGIIVDGTGQASFQGDVGIKDDKIAKIGDLSNEKGDSEIDAAGRMVCPGFVDINNHSDTYWRIFSNPDLESLVYQGITTIVGGNCGTSLAPLRSPDTINSIQKWTDIRKVTVDWIDLPEFFSALSRNPLSVNFGTLIGHATLRRGFLGDSARNPTPEEMEIMEEMLKISLERGALGMSSGLVYTHARTTGEEELGRLARIIKKKSKVYTSHIRGEGGELIDSVEEAIRIAEETGVNLHVSHLKAMGESSWPLMNEALALVGKAFERGVEVSFDVYPYTNTGSVLYTLLPAWASEGGRGAMLTRLRDVSTRGRIIQEMKEGAFDYSKIEIAISPINRTLARKKIAEIALAQNKTPEEAVVDVLLASEGQVVGSMDVLSQENVDRAVIHPLSIISSNGSGYNVSHSESGELVHPRSFGTFPRVLRDYVRERRLLSWEEAVHKMTWKPAEKFSIPKRGRIKEGFFADLLIVDRSQVRDLATKENPFQYSKGIDFVLVNGKIILADGQFLGGRFGETILN